MEQVVFPAPGIILARIETADPDEAKTQLAIAGWNEDGNPVLIGNDGELRLVRHDETIVDLEFET